MPVISDEKAVAWEIANQVDHLANKPLPWTERLESIGTFLLRKIGGDAIWILTLSPLQIGASGVLRTPVTSEPDAVVSLTDAFPPINDHWPPEQSILADVLKTGRPVYARHFNGHHQSIDNDLADALLNVFDVSVQAIIPIRTGSQPLGVLLIGARPGNDFLTDQKEYLLEFVGQHLGLALRNAQLLETAHRQAEQLATLNRIARTITSSLDLESVIQRTMAGINEILDVEAGSLLLLDERSNELYFKITLRGENKQVTSFRLQVGQGIAGWVVQQQRPALVNNVRGDARFFPEIDRAIGFTTRSVLCTPLVVQGVPLGALEVINKRSGFFTEEDQELLTSMTASLAVALRNAGLFDKAQERAQRTEIINRITTIINSSTDLVNTARHIVEQLHSLFPFDRLALALLDDAQRNFVPYFLDEIGLHEIDTLNRTLKGSGLESIVERGQGAIIPDLRQTPNFPERRALLEESLRSTLTVPLKSQGKVAGTLTLASREVDLYRPDHQDLLELLSPALTAALEKARFIDLIEQRANELKMLNRMGEMLASTNDFSVILETALNTLPRLISADLHGLVIAEEGGVRLGIVIPYAGSGRLVDNTRDHLLDTFKETREDRSPPPVLEMQAIAGNLPVEDNWEAVATLTLPVITRIGCLGIVYLASGRHSGLGDNQLRLLSLVVSQLSTALENAYLFRQVRQERARLAAFLDSTADAILVVDKRGRIVLDNPAALEVLEVKTSQAGQLLQDVTKNEALLALFARANRDGRAAGEIPVADEKTFYAVISPVKSDETEMSGWLAALQDVTHFKELDQMKSDFVNAVSHDLRSPLSGIDIACHLIGQIGQMSDRQHELLNTIHNRVQAMTELIDELLDVGKLEAGIDMKMEPCELGPVVSEIVEGMNEQARQKVIALSAEIAPNLPPVQGNPTRLRQAVSNLVGNAIKYTPAGGRVSVQLRQQTDGMILFQVKDSGPGIPKADQPRIFDKFYRVRGEHMVGQKGTGLGLAITKTIVEKHHGKIWVDSEFGQGSTFSFSLPIPDPVVSKT